MHLVIANAGAYGRVPPLPDRAGSGPAFGGFERSVALYPLVIEGDMGFATFVKSVGDLTLKSTMN